MHYLSKEIWRFCWIIVIANILERSEVLLLYRFVLNLVQYCLHHVLTNILFVALLQKNVVEARGGNFLSVLFIPELPVNLHQLSKLN